MINHCKKALARIKLRLNNHKPDERILEDLKRVEDTANFYYDLLYRFPVAVFVTDVETDKLLWANQETEALFGKEHTSTLDKYPYLIQDKMHPVDFEDRKKKLAWLRAHPEQVQQVSYRIKGQKAEGYRWNYGFIALSSGEGGQPQGFVHTFLGVHGRLSQFLTGLKGTVPNADGTTEEKVKLTEREQSVLRLIAEGYTIKEVAVSLKISYHTAATHRKNLFRKTSVKKTSELVHYALRHKLV